MKIQQKVHDCHSSVVSSNLTSSVSISLFAVSVMIQQCFCRYRLNTLGASQHQVFSFYIQMTLCITCSFEICIGGVCIYMPVHERSFLPFVCTIWGFSYGLFMQVIPLRETLCQGRASVLSACILYSHMI